MSFAAINVGVLRESRFTPPNHAHEVVVAFRAFVIVLSGNQRNVVINNSRRSPRGLPFGNDYLFGCRNFRDIRVIVVYGNFNGVEAMLLIIGKHAFRRPVVPVIELHFVALGGFSGQEFGKVHRVGRIDVFELAGSGEMIPGSYAMIVEIPEDGFGCPGIAALISRALVQSVQLIRLGGQILHHVEERIRAAVFGIAVAHEIFVAHPRLVVCLAVGRRQK